MLRINDLLILATTFALAIGVVAAMDVLRHRQDRLARDILKACFFYNLAAVAFFTMQPSAIYKTFAVYLIPFATISSYLRHAVDGTLDIYTILYNMAGNILLLLPTGLLLPVIWPTFRRFWKCLLVCVSFSIGIEIIQFLMTSLGALYRTTDIDDVILNTLGAMAGYGLYALGARILGKQRSKKPVEQPN